MRSKKINLIIGILLFVLADHSSGQDIKIGYDTNRIRKTMNKTTYPDYIIQQYWIIANDTIRFYEFPITYQSGSSLMDTIYYRGYRQKETDTILFSNLELRSFNFHYNECCGGFNVMSSLNNKFNRASFTIELVNACPDKKYIAILGESGLFLLNKGDTIISQCRSAMSSNVIPFKIIEYETCIDSIGQINETCLINTNKEISLYDFCYKINYIHLDMLFIPLKPEPYHFKYDIKFNKIISIK
jgi:hypothetical protein